MVSMGPNKDGPFVILLLLTIVLLLLMVVADDGMLVVVLLMFVLLAVGDVGVELLFVMFKEFILLFVEFKLLLLQLLLLTESAYVMASGGDEALFEASEDVDVVRSLTKVPSGRTKICLVPII